jgi:hypothetical protein
MLGSDDEDKDLILQPEAELDPTPDSIAAVMVFGGFNPILEPGLSPNLTELNHAINIGTTMASHGLVLVPKPAQTTFKRLYTIYDCSPTMSG